MGESTRASIDELFFDLVFVFAFIQVVALMADDFTGRGVLRGMLVLALLWWSWSCFAWLGNNFQTTWGLPRFGVVVATAIMFVMAVVTRDAFTRTGGGLGAPVVFAGCYLAVRLTHLAVHGYGVQRSRRLAIVAVPMLIGAGLLFGAALAPQRLLDATGHPDVAVTVLWLLAVVIDYGGSLRLPHWEWAIFSAQHWAQRHGLIVIIALGESLIVIGLGLSRPGLSWHLVSVALLGVAVAAALQWMYFDVVALAGEQTIRDTDPRRRVSLGRDSYSYLHLPMIAGILLLALGLKEVLATLPTSGHRRSGQLHGLGLLVLYGGVILFLLGNAGFQVRIHRTLNTILWPRIVTVVLLAALVPVAATLPAIWTLSLLAGVCITLVAVEIVVADGQRRDLRQALLSEER